MMQSLEKARAISNLPKEQRARNREEEQEIRRGGNAHRDDHCQRKMIQSWFSLPRPFRPSGESAGLGVSNSEGGRAKSPARFPPGLPAQIPQIALYGTLDVTKQPLATPRNGHPR
jgi:hypothetical protein